MGRYGDSIGLGSCQQHGFGHGDRRGCWNELNGDDHDDTDWVHRWLSTNHGNVGGGCCIDSNVWKHNSNG